MIARNADVIAVTLLIAAALLCSSAREVVISDLGGTKHVFFDHRTNGPEVWVVAPIPPATPLPLSH